MPKQAHRINNTKIVGGNFELSFSLFSMLHTHRKQSCPSVKAPEAAVPLPFLPVLESEVVSLALLVTKLLLVVRGQVMVDVGRKVDHRNRRPPPQTATVPTTKQSPLRTKKSPKPSGYSLVSTDIVAESKAGATASAVSTAPRGDDDMF